MLNIIQIKHSHKNTTRISFHIALFWSRFSGLAAEVFTLWVWKQEDDRGEYSGIISPEYRTVVLEYSPVILSFRD